MKRVLIGIFILGSSAGGAAYALRTLPERPPNPLPSDDRRCPHAMAWISGGHAPALRTHSDYSTEMVDTLVADFCLDRNETTVEDYEKCVSAKKCARPSQFPNDVDSAGECNYGVQRRKEHPVNCLSYADAEQFCSFEGKRLPTRQEWEYAAEGGTARTRYAWGNTEPRGQLCWSGEERRTGTCVVRSFPAENFGLFDMAGNVREYVSLPLVMLQTGDKDDEDAFRLWRDRLWLNGGDWDVGPGKEENEGADGVNVYVNAGWRGPGRTGFRCAK